MFSVFFGRTRSTDYDGARRQDAFRYTGFFHAMLERGVYLPPSAFESWFRLRRARRRGAGARRRRAAARRARRAAATRGVDGMSEDRSMTETTVVHVLRHGEVHNPTKVLYGRLPDFHLSELGVAMAERIAERLRGEDVTHLVSSPLERAQETAAPSAAVLGLPVAVDDRLIEAGNVFEGLTFGVGDGSLRRPAHWLNLRNPFRRPGASRTSRSPSGCWPRSRQPATPLAGTRR
jgi:hypothetical protein